ncbi:MAG: GGDEF domain-containing protein [Acidimicrobiia bacterium]|nr:GGDEF domain-containing protein [Acidimicrobiia bacterium]
MLDTVTLALLAALATVLGAALVGVMAIIYPTVPGLRHWAAAELLLALGFGVYVIRGSDLAVAISVVAGNGLVYTALYHFAEGNRALAGERAPRPMGPFVAALATHLAALTFLTVVVENFPLRSALNSLGFAGLSVLIAWDLWPMLRRPGRQFGARIVTTAFAVHGAFHLVRAVLSFSQPASEQFLDGTPLTQATYLAEFTLALIVLGGLIALVGEHLRRRIEELAELDSLTGILNRRAFFLLAQVQLNLALRHGEPVSLLMVDIDRFKAVNDTHGHLVGDAVLRGVAATLGDDLRAHDLIGRFGGEEFILLLYGLDAVDATVVAERLRTRVPSHTARSRDQEVGVTVSIGVTGGYPDPSWTVDSLIAKADDALYRAKDMGRNRVEANRMPYRLAKADQVYAD